MQRSTRGKLEARKRRASKRIDKSHWNGQSPMIDPPTIHYELAERTQAIAAGGLGLVQQLVRQREVAESINRGCVIFKFHSPYPAAAARQRAQTPQQFRTRSTLVEGLDIHQ